MYFYGGKKNNLTILFRIIKGVNYFDKLMILCREIKLCQIKLQILIPKFKHSIEILTII